MSRQPARSHPSGTRPCTPVENRAALVELRTVLDIHAISRPYRDGPPSTLQHIYVEVRSHGANGDRNE
jgi:hypothetical protein